MKTNASLKEVKAAIKAVNDKYGYKIIFNRCETIGKYLHFTIKSEKSGIPGSRTSWSGRKLISASWHAHGYLFDELFALNPDAVVYSNGRKITEDEGNWQDANIGNYYNPVMFSETSIL